MYKWAKQTRGWNEDFWSNILFNWPQIIPLTTTFPIIQKSEHNASQLNGFYMMGIFTSSRSEVFCKKGIITCFVKFTGHRPATLLKKRLWHSCFPVNYAKFLRTPFLTEHLRWLLLTLQSQQGSFLRCQFFYSFIEYWGIWNV